MSTPNTFTAPGKAKEWGDENKTFLKKKFPSLPECHRSSSQDCCCADTEAAVPGVGHIAKAGSVWDCQRSTRSCREQQEELTEGLTGHSRGETAVREWEKNRKSIYREKKKKSWDEINKQIAKAGEAKAERRELEKLGKHPSEMTRVQSDPARGAGLAVRALSPLQFCYSMFNFKGALWRAAAWEARRNFKTHLLAAVA